MATDTSSLIILQKVGLLNRTAQAINLFGTPWVWQELHRHASPIEAAQFSSALIVRPQREHRFYLNDEADNSVVALYAVQACDAVLADDGKILNYCRRQNIPHYCCLSLLAVLIQQNVLHATEVQDYFEAIRHTGRYSDWVIETARNLIDATR